MALLNGFAQLRSSCLGILVFGLFTPIGGGLVMMGFISSLREPSTKLWLSRLGVYFC
jgi:hypothetical protein